ncbi:MAG: Gfo/Idh/MocA family oxidoreductase [Candidatus Caenarcaniphilales bacterium]|jgi:UDP-2-acetamido-3-amino-2,3-dideoxy-glucuronate N-acetyltransferase|nr:Gfo/Idh/MocA family oxidoreductase [Candidatus Caenarcaniphilales bacterium]
MKIAVVGCGHWGKNLVRNFYELGVLAAVCDHSKASADHVIANHPSVNFTFNYQDILEDKPITAVVIATPANTHYELAYKALEANKHVYVEKPLAKTFNEAVDLHKLAEQKSLILMVGHLLLYHPAVNKLKNLIASGELGTIQYINSDRRNFNRSQQRDTNVMWDLAPHDISMMSYILNTEPEIITSARGWSNNNEIVEVVHLDFTFPNNIGAHIHNSWLDPQKQALLTVNGSKKTAVLNDTFKENKLEIYSRNDDGSITVEKPVYSNDEPLRLECKHFLDCILHKTTPTSDGSNGSFVVRYLEECESKMIVNSTLAAHS